MRMKPDPYRGFRFPAELISHAVWLYYCFSLSLRDVETILTQRGIVVSYESIRAYGTHLALGPHRHSLDAGEGSPSGPEVLKAQHRRGSALDPAMVLLDHLVEPAAAAVPVKRQSSPSRVISRSAPG